MQGKILVTGIRYHAFHGLTEMERQVGVRHCVDVEMIADIGRAVECDHIEATIDYRKVHEIVIQVARENSFHLLETLAGHIARRILVALPCTEVTVRLRKETPVLDGMVDSVGVELTLEREGTRE